MRLRFIICWRLTIGLRLTISLRLLIGLRLSISLRLYIGLGLHVGLGLSIALRITTISSMGIAVRRIIATITVSKIVAIAIPSIAVLMRIWEIKSFQSIRRVSTTKIFSKMRVCTLTSMGFLFFNILVFFLVLAVPITTKSIAAKA